MKMVQKVLVLALIVAVPAVLAGSIVGGRVPNTPSRDDVPPPPTPDRDRDGTDDKGGVWDDSLNPRRGSPSKASTRGLNMLDERAEIAKVDKDNKDFDSRVRRFLSGGLLQQYQENKVDGRKNRPNSLAVYRAYLRYPDEREKMLQMEERRTPQGCVYDSECRRDIDVCCYDGRPAMRGVCSSAATCSVSRATLSGVLVSHTDLLAKTQGAADFQSTVGGSFSVVDEMDRYKCEAEKVMDQSSCGTCWAFAAATAYSQRLCKKLKHAGNLLISPQGLVETDKFEDEYAEYKNDVRKGRRAKYDNDWFVTQDRGGFGGRCINAFINMQWKGSRSRHDNSHGVMPRYCRDYTCTKDDEGDAIMRATNERSVVKRMCHKSEAFAYTERGRPFTFNEPEDVNRNDRPVNHPFYHEPRQTHHWLHENYQLGEALKQELRENGPVTISMDADFIQLRNNAMAVWRGTVKIPIRMMHTVTHAVVLVGWGTETLDDGSTIDYWQIQNSWGHEWNGQGYIRVQRGYEKRCVEWMEDPSVTPEGGPCGFDFFASMALLQMGYPGYPGLVGAQISTRTLNELTELAQDCSWKNCGRGHLVKQPQCGCKCYRPWTRGSDGACNVCPIKCNPRGTEEEDKENCACRCKQGYWGEGCEKSVSVSVCRSSNVYYFQSTYNNLDDTVVDWNEHHNYEVRGRDSHTKFLAPALPRSERGKKIKTSEWKRMCYDQWADFTNRNAGRCMDVGWGSFFYFWQDMGPTEFRTGRRPRVRRYPVLAQMVSEEHLNAIDTRDVPQCSHLGGSGDESRFRRRRRLGSGPMLGGSDSDMDSQDSLPDLISVNEDVSDAQPDLVRQETDKRTCPNKREFDQDDELWDHEDEVIAAKDKEANRNNNAGSDEEEDYDPDAIYGYPAADYDVDDIEHMQAGDKSGSVSPPVTPKDDDDEIPDEISERSSDGTMSSGRLDDVEPLEDDGMPHEVIEISKDEEEAEPYRRGDDSGDLKSTGEDDLSLAPLDINSEDPDFNGFPDADAVDSETSDGDDGE